MSDMMAVVTEMMNFPLKTTPTVAPAPQVTNPKNVPQQQTSPAFTQTSPTRPQIDGRVTSSPNRVPATPATATQFGNRIIDTNTPRTPPPPSVPVTPNAQPNSATGGQQTITKEGDFENNLKTNTDRLNTDTSTTFSNQPIFVSNLGELSTDAGNKFDINKSKIVKPDTNNPITPAPISTKQQATNQLKQSLAASFQNRQNANAAAIPPRTIAETNLLQSLQQVLRQNPDAISGEADLIEFIQRILERNPDLTPDQLNAILSAESDSIVGILANSVNRNQNNPADAKINGKNQLLDSIQSVLNKYKTGSPVPPAVQTAPAIPFVQQTPAIGTTAPNFQSIPVIGRPIPVAVPAPVPVPVVAVKNTPAIGSRIPIAQSIPIVARPLEVITGTPIIGSLAQAPVPVPVAIPAPIPVQVPIVKTTTVPGRPRVPVLSGVIEPQIIDFIAKNNRPTQTPIAQSVRLPAAPPAATQFVNQRPINQPIPTQNLNQIPNFASNSIQLPPAPASTLGVPNNPSFGVVQPPPSLPSAPQTVANALGAEAIESGEADLVQILQQILLRAPNQLSPIFSGEADIVTFIEQIKRQNPDFSTRQLNAIISGEANSILQILNGSAQRNLEQGYPQIYEADLLEAIQLVIQKYRANTQNQLPSSPALAAPPSSSSVREPVFSGESDLISASLRRLQERIPIPIFSGSADLLEFIRRIEQRNPNLTRDQLNAILSGEADSILQIFNERRAQNGGAQTVYSGSADLLEAIQQVRMSFQF